MLVVCLCGEVGFFSTNFYPSREARDFSGVHATMREPDGEDYFVLGSDFKQD